MVHKIRNMKIVFVSNFYNHHQAPLSNELYEKTNGNYWFIETVPMDDERLKLGWNNRNLPHFVKKSYLSDEEYQLCKSLILHADIVITGSAPNSILKERLISKKIVLRYSERIYKNKKQYLTFPVRLFKYHIQDYKSKNVYMLCSSAYAKIDYNLTLNYIGKCFKYGYFPECLSYDDIDTIVSEKDHNSIIWVGRFIEWKHPEVPVHVAKLLKSKGITFNLTLIGEGPLKTKIQSMVIKENLADCVSVIGPMEPSNVRKHMEKAQVFLFTSDRGEGWGAVLNEAMNSGCVSIVNKEIGSAPFLI